MPEADYIGLPLGAPLPGARDALDAATKTGPAAAPEEVVLLSGDEPGSLVVMTVAAWYEAAASSYAATGLGGVRYRRADAPLEWRTDFSGITDKSTVVVWYGGRPAMARREGCDLIIFADERDIEELPDEEMTHWAIFNLPEVKE